MRVLVTGADGFVGRWLVRRLLTDGRDVYGAVRPGQSPAPVAPAADLSPDERAAVRWLPLELGDTESVLNVVGLPYDAVVHLAATPTRASGASYQFFCSEAWYTDYCATRRMNRLASAWQPTFLLIAKNCR